MSFNKKRLQEHNIDNKKHKLYVKTNLNLLNISEENEENIENINTEYDNTEYNNLKINDNKVNSTKIKLSIMKNYRYIKQYHLCATEVLKSDVLVYEDNKKIFHEIEVKISKQDFLNDFKKKKYKENGRKYLIKPNMFSFCVPEDMKEFCLQYLKDNYNDYGLIVYYPYVDEIKIVKRAKHINISDNDYKFNINALYKRLSSEVITLRIKDYYNSNNNVNNNVNSKDKDLYVINKHKGYWIVNLELPYSNCIKEFDDLKSAKKYLLSAFTKQKYIAINKHTNKKYINYIYDTTWIKQYIRKGY